MKIVMFLDFDGPIFPEKIHLYPQNQGDIAAIKCKELDLHPHVKYWYADPFAIAILNSLKDKYDYQLVISSSWADDRLHEKKHIEKLLKENGLKYDFHEDWRTPRKLNKSDGWEERQKEIETWLANHPEVGDKYIILDDTKSAPSLFFEKTYLTSTLKQRNVYLAHEKDGFSYEQFDDMIFYMDILNNNKSKCSI